MTASRGRPKVTEGKEEAILSGAAGDAVEDSRAMIVRPALLMVSDQRQVVRFVEKRTGPTCLNRRLSKEVK